MAEAPSPAIPDEALRQASEFLRTGRWREAESLYRSVLARDPDRPEALHGLGILACQAGQTNAGAQLLRRAVELRPTSPELHSDLANALRIGGQIEAALAADRRAVELAPDSAFARQSLGQSLQLAGRHDEAIDHFRRAIALHPDSPVALCHLGNLLFQRGNPDEAVTAFRTSVRLRPTLVEAHYNLAKVLRGQGRLDEAAEQLQRAIQLRPGLAPAYNLLGNVLRDQGRSNEAIDAYQKALRLRPNHALTHGNLGLAYQDAKQFDRAMACFDRALQLSPDDAEAHTFRAMALLQRGDFERGWAEYEWRWRIQGAFSPPSFAQPAWDGSDPAGRTLLLYSEQGLGDTLQFARYVPLVARRGARVVLRCQPELKELLRVSFDGVAEVVGPDDALPEFDVHTSLLSLPRWFGTTLTTVPAQVPYVRVDPSRSEAWRTRLGPAGCRRRVGLAWAGRPSHVNDRHRSLTLQAFAPLASVPGATFYSLQKGPAAGQALHAPDGMRLVDFTPELTDFSETTALVAHLDLVVSVDTSVVHLAGALGRPVWTLLPYSADWRWMEARSDSPWYPTMRLFRQPSPGDWSTVIRQVAGALTELGRMTVALASTRQDDPR